MKMSKIKLIAAASAACLALSSCKFFNYKGEDGAGYDGSQPSDLRVTVDFEVENFDEITVEGSFNIIYVAGEPSASVTIADNKVHEIIVKTSDNHLTIKPAYKKARLGKVDIVVSSPMLNDLEIAGACSFKTDATIYSQGFDATVAGAGKLYIGNLQSDGDVDCNIAGAGRFEFGTVRCKDFDAQIAGSGKIDVGDIVCESCDLGIAGSGNISISGNAKEDCEVYISGSGRIDMSRLSIAGKYSQKISGSGKIIR